MRVSETLELSIPEDGLDVNRLERYLAREMERFRKRVFGKVLRQIEAKKLEEAKGRVSCREKVSRYLFTRQDIVQEEAESTSVLILHLVPFKPC